MSVGGTVASLIGLCGALVLVVAGLRRRRLGTRSVLLLAVTWIGIIAMLWAIAAIGLRFSHAYFT